MLKPLSQRSRFLLLLSDVLVLLLAARVAFGDWWPANNSSGFWFYSALLGLLLGNRIDTPFFVKPADVFLYASPAAIALLLTNSWSVWSLDVQVAFVIALAYSSTCILLAAIAILTNGSANERSQRTSNACRLLAESLGSPKMLFSVVVAFALYAFHRDTTREFTIIVVAWLFIGVFSPIENLIQLGARIHRVFLTPASLSQHGEVVAFQSPGLLLVRQAASSTISLGALLGVREVDGGAGLARVLDYVGRDEGVLLRAIEIESHNAMTELRLCTDHLSPQGVVCVPDSILSRKENGPDDQTSQIIGLVSANTSIERLFFEVIADDKVEEGHLVQVRVRGTSVLYQIVNGLTREEVVRQRNTRGYAQAQAQKIGIWDSEKARFVGSKWLPRANEPVYLQTTRKRDGSRDAVGHFPGTSYEVRLKDIGSLVTHNTAILGILGVGKSSLAFELVERLLSGGIKVICLDLTGEYEAALAPFVNSEKQDRFDELLMKATNGGKDNVQQNVEEGGSRTAFAMKLRELVANFLKSQKEDATRLLVINPARFDVWRQDSKQFSGKASMVSLTAAEITHLVTEAALEAAASLGPSKEARLCMVYEEAHALVPEWNSTIAEGDRAASNGTARAILQGRKFGMGCILITQRTANVTKTILNQCNTIFAMRTFDDTGKGFLANYVGSEYANALPSLSERHAVLYGRASSCENPVLIRLNDRDDFLTFFRVEADAMVEDVSDSIALDTPLKFDPPPLGGG